MAEELKPEEKEIIPEPNEDQNTLWEYLGSVFDEEALLREEKFINLDPKTRNRLASVSLAGQIGRIGEKFSLADHQHAELAKAVRYVALGEIPPDNLVTKLQDMLKINADQASGIAGDEEFKSLIAFEATPAPKEEISAEPSEELPFMLHKEEPMFTPTAPQDQPSVSFVPEKRAEPPKVQPKKITVRIEAPEEDAEESSANGKSRRVVHYSNFRTPLDADAKDAK